ncbi:MAG TPA: hypothetical protein VJX23_03065 [Candidatus Binataceae bacterium]|nr:hypothetical protein [Candidatus Binataceae bacterium]
MPCRPEDVELVICDRSAAFPPTFPLDTDLFQAALAEHNWIRTRAGLPNISFLELEREEQQLVLARAQELKTGPAGARSSVAAQPSLAVAAAPPPSRLAWWVRGLLALDRACDRLGLWFWGPE